MPEEETEYHHNPRPEPTDYSFLLFKYLRYWYLFGAGLLLCVGLALVYLRYATPQYNISSTLLLKNDEKEAKLTKSDVFEDLDIFTTVKNIDNEILVLKSKSLMQRVMEELSLQASYYLEGRLKNREIYGSELPLRIIINKLDSTAFKKNITLHLKGNNGFDLEEGNLQKSSHKFGQEIRKPYGRFTIVAAPGYSSSDKRITEKIIIRFNDVEALADYYSADLKVEAVNKKASVLTISMTTAVPEKGKDIVNKLIEVYNKEALEDKNLIAASTLDFIDERLKYLTTELNEVEKNVEQYKQENQVTDVSSEANTYRERISNFNKQLSDLDIQIDVLNSIEKYLQNQGNRYELVPSSLSIDDRILFSLITKFNDLQLERERLLQLNKPGNPLIQNTNEQLLNLKANILENLRNIKNGLVITRRNLQSSSRQFETQLQKVPLIERQLLEINRDRAIKQDLYLYLLQKREEAAMSLSATNHSNLRIIDPAMSSNKPVKPKKMIVLLIAFVMGLGLPFAAIFAKDMFNTSIQHKKDIARLTNVPVIGEIAHNDTGKKLVVTKKSRSSIAEVFQLVRANLQFATNGNTSQVILVTSAVSGEGKSFFSLNLGASIGLTGKKVALLEFDLRHPGLLQDLSLSTPHGITDYLLSDNMTIQDLFTNSMAAPNLYVIPAGNLLSNPVELMAHPKIKLLMDELRNIFDYIILDTAPVGLVADAYSLAPYADAAVFLMRYNFTSKDQISLVNEIQANKKFKQPLIVLNDARKTNGYKDGYGYVKEKKDKSKNKTVSA